MKVVQFSRPPTPLVHRTLLCVQLPKIIYNYLYFWYSFSNQSILLAQLEDVNKLWDNSVNVNEQNNNNKKTEPNHVTFKLTTRSIVRFSPQTMQWYHERMTSLSDAIVKRKIFCQ